MKKIMINPSCGAPLPLFKIVFLWARGPQKHNLNLPFGGEAAENPTLVSFKPPAAAQNSQVIF